MIGTYIYDTLWIRFLAFIHSPAAFVIDSVLSALEIPKMYDVEPSWYELSMEHGLSFLIGNTGWFAMGVGAGRVVARVKHFSRRRPPSP